jgi:4-hydroxy-4-methyl-2-oxoglutarate aldolase
MVLNGLRQRALACGASTVYEAGGGVGALDPAIRPVWHGATLCGPAFPVMCAAGDNLAVHRALERCQPGDVLVITAAGEDSGYMGEVLANAAQARGVTGVVVDGGVRDIDALERMRFPVFARWISMRRTVKREPGEIGQAIRAGGVLVGPGSIVVADADGVFVSDEARFEQAVVAAEARVAREMQLIKRIKNGELTLDLLGLRRAGD